MPYGNEIILQVIRDMWFKKRSALSHLFIDECGEEIPLAVVALAVTAVRD
jgi:hypothetical protein